MKAVCEDDDRTFERLYDLYKALKAWQDRNPEPDRSDAKYDSVDRYWEQFARDKHAYMEREIAAKRSVGLAEAQLARNKSIQRWEDAALSFSDIEAQSIRDVVFKAEIPSGRGFFYPPSVLCSVPVDAAMAHEESLVRWRRFAASIKKSKRSSGQTMPNTVRLPTSIQAI